MLGTSPEEMLKRVQARSTAGLNAKEMREFVRLIGMGGFRSAKREHYGRKIEELWEKAEARIRKEIKG